jgi:Glyoxalase-like domain
MEIDHIFVFVDAVEAEAKRLKEHDLRETYRRTHVGQGTQNICYAFNNMFIELLWVDSPTDIKSPNIARTKLFERSRWKDNGACPFGIAWRGNGASAAIPTWTYSPPYLPEGIGIEVAIDSDDEKQPMMFTFPHSTAPDRWSQVRRGNLQTEFGYKTISHIEIIHPPDYAASPAMIQMLQETVPPMRLVRGEDWSMNLTLDHNDHSRSTVMTLPTNIIH